MKKYKVIASKFIGYNDSGSATYEITFNQSLEHTGRFQGIEKGLDDYCKKELRTSVIDNFKMFCKSLFIWIKSLKQPK